MPMAALADFTRINDESAFRQAIAGKTLTRPLVRLTVLPNGEITGRGVRWDVQGSWSWRDGFFCRDLNRGGTDLGFNCQEVRISGSKVRFTSDKGAGDSADFRLRAP